MTPIEQARDAREYVARYGGRCRDCADHDNICPTNGLPCNVEDRNKAIDHVIKALNYGIQHGFLSPSTPVDGVGAEPDDDATCTCCGGTGVTYQTERRCACQGPDVSALANSETEARLAQAGRGPAVTEAMVDTVGEELFSRGHTKITKQDVRAALEAALHPQSAAGEEG